MCAEPCCSQHKFKIKVQTFLKIGEIMFVEKLTKEDIMEFINSCSIKEYSITDINHFNFYGINSNRNDINFPKS